MRGIPPFSDARLRAYCIYCSKRPGTRDHVPPSVFLDKPYPEHLPVVPSCRECNQSTSLDEEYLACRLEVVVCQTAEPEAVERVKIASSLRHSRRLRERLDNALQLDRAEPRLSLELDRINRVVEKVARGLWSYETSETTADLQTQARTKFAGEATEAELEAFFALEMPEMLPEVGSRMMMRLVHHGLRRNDWVILQPERFSYGVEVFGHNGRVKLLVRGCLLAEVDILSDW